MRGIPSLITDIRKRVFTEIARMAYEGGDYTRAEDLPYVWDRYYKVDKAHKRAAVGTGLGLSIVRGMVELHGGRYGVESQPGQGSRFWFSLPVWEG